MTKLNEVRFWFIACKLQDLNNIKFHINNAGNFIFMILVNAVNTKKKFELGKNYLNYDLNRNRRNAVFTFCSFRFSLKNAHKKELHWSQSIHFDLNKIQLSLNFRAFKFPFRNIQCNLNCKFDRLAYDNFRIFVPRIVPITLC